LLGCVVFPQNTQNSQKFPTSVHIRAICGRTSQQEILCVLRVLWEILKQTFVFLLIQQPMNDISNKSNHNSQLSTLNSQLKNNSQLKISDLSEADRPREKLRDRGTEALSDAELLAILIGSGSTSESAVALMQRILSACDNNLNTLGKRSLHELMQYKGIGEAKAITIIAACELGKRRQAAKAAEHPDMGSAQAVYEYMHPKMQDLDTEEAWVLLMNQRFRLIKAVRLSHGGLTETAVDVRVILREALLANATTLTLIHNHPSGNARPSGDDDRITHKLKTACDAMRLYLIDHLIVTDGNYYSYAEEGKI
jgi:DNA repair protein RadC